MMSEVNYRYFVKPLTPNTNEAIAASLAASEPSTTDVEKQKITVDGQVVVGVYQVLHGFLTELERSAHFAKVRVYVQEDEGRIRIYKLFGKSKRGLGRTKAVRGAKAALAKVSF